MPFPLLALGLLAAARYGQQKFKDYRDDETAGQVRGLLGRAAGPMGPPDESGQMGYSQGQGLLADPKDIGRQLEFAAGLSGMRGGQATGLNLLNAAFGRAQQQAESQQQAGQFAQQFGAGREDAASQQQRFAQSQAQQQEQWDRQFGASREDAARQSQQWYQQFGLSQNADKRAEQSLGLDRERLALAQKQQEDGGEKLARLPAGWHYVPGAEGQAVAAPVPGTSDWTTGTAKAESLQAAKQRIGTMLDMLQGREQVTEQGRKVRKDGSGTELYGPTAEKYSVLRGQMIADVAKLRDMGVLQAGEMENIDKQLRDPTSFGGMFTKNSTIASGYEEMQKQFADKLEQHFRSNPWLLPPVPKGFEAVKH